MNQPNEQAWRVEWYVNGPDVRHDVTVRIGQGRVLEVQSGLAADAIDLGQVAMIPGLVNAHTHLEFNLLRKPIPTRGRFTDWIRKVVAYRRDHAGQTAKAIRQGILECVRSGTTLIGDIATTGWDASDYSTAGFHGVVFQELLGLGPERVAAQCELAQQTAARRSVDSLHFGLSPHAPYSVHPDLLSTAMQQDRPIAMHLAETKSELQLLAEGTGEFREMLTEFGIWQEGLFGGRNPKQILEALATAPRALVIHGNYLNDADLEFIAAHPSMTLVYCPRTHAAFGHPEHPWRRLRQMGGRIAIGTDSRASNPDLSLFAELQFLAARYPDVSHLDLLSLGTQCGRHALLGDVADEGRADFCVVRLEHPNGDLGSSLFSAGNRVIGTMIAGRWCYPCEQTNSGKPARDA